MSTSQADYYGLQLWDQLLQYLKMLRLTPSSEEYSLMQAIIPSQLDELQKLLVPPEPVVVPKPGIDPSYVPPKILPRTEPLKIVDGRKQDMYVLLWACKFSENLKLLPKDIVKVICGYIYHSREYRPGDWIDVLDTVKKWYPCYVMDVRKQEGKQQEVFIHYFGWDIRYDEWIEVTSHRLAPIFTFENYYGQLGTHLNPDRPKCKFCEEMKAACTEKNYHSEHYYRFPAPQME